MTEKINYWNGYLAHPHEHKQLIEIALTESMELYPQEKFIVKFVKEEEARTLKQNDTLHSLLGLLVDSKWFDDMDITKDAIAYKLRDRGNFIKYYMCRNKGQKRRNIKDEQEAIKYNTCEPVHRSTALLGKKDFALYLDYVLNLCEKINKNGDGFGDYAKKYEQILIGLGEIRN